MPSGRARTAAPSRRPGTSRCRCPTEATDQGDSIVGANANVAGSDGTDGAGHPDHRLAPDTVGDPARPGCVDDARWPPPSPRGRPSPRSPSRRIVMPSARSIQMMAPRFARKPAGRHHEEARGEQPDVASLAAGCRCPRPRSATRHHDIALAWLRLAALAGPRITVPIAVANSTHAQDQRRDREVLAASGSPGEADEAAADHAERRHHPHERAGGPDLRFGDEVRDVPLERPLGEVGAELQQQQEGDEDDGRREVATPSEEDDVERAHRRRCTACGGPSGSPCSR